jgi:hypothetical protein
MEDRADELLNRIALYRIACRVEAGEDVPYAEVEDVLAKLGFAVVSREMGELLSRILASPETATSEEFSAVMYAIYASRYGDFWPCKVFA